MPKLIERCKHCNKQAEVIKEDRIEAFGQIFKTYSCGHTVCEEIASFTHSVAEGNKLVCKTCLLDLTNVNGRMKEHELHELVEIPVSRDLMFARAMDYQKTGVEFLERSNYRASLNDEQGLGKTIQALLAIKHNKEKLTPTLFVVKSKLKLNWAQEMLINGWLCDRENPLDYPFIIADGQMAIIPGFRYYIISMSMLEKSKEILKSFNFQLIVVDESQNFVNMKSQRTKALLEIGGKIPYRICMSGTPVINRASEYWPTLNLIKPDHWTNYESFLRNWVDYDLTEAGAKRYTGLKKSMRETFFQKTSSYILRRRKRDVLKDLPPFARHFEIVDISGSNLKSAYNKQANELEEFLISSEYKKQDAFTRSSTILGYLMRMRHLTGLAKTPQLIEDVQEFLETCEDKTEKIIIGVHHDDVMDLLKVGLAAFNPVLIQGGLDDEETRKRIEKFRSVESRVCVAKILAAGEGLNLQFCQNMIVFERQWNAGKEEQFEARIDRPAKCQKDNQLLRKNGEVLTCPACGFTEPVIPRTATYKVAKNTVDEVFTQMVEEKRKNCGETIDEEFNFEMNPNLLSMLGEKASRLRV